MTAMSAVSSSWRTRAVPHLRARVLRRCEETLRGRFWFCERADAVYRGLRATRLSWWHDLADDDRDATTMVCGIEAAFVNDKPFLYERAGADRMRHLACASVSVLREMPRPVLVVAADVPAWREALSRHLPPHVGMATCGELSCASVVRLWFRETADGRTAPRVLLLAPGEVDVDALSHTRWGLLVLDEVRESLAIPPSVAIACLFADATPVGGDALVDLIDFVSVDGQHDPPLPTLRGVHDGLVSELRERGVPHAIARPIATKVVHDRAQQFADAAFRPLAEWGEGAAPGSRVVVPVG
jgi:hypothetical protein